MVTLPNHSLRQRIQRIERRLPPLIAQPEVTIRVFGNEEDGGYTITTINYGSHTRTFVFDLDPDEYAEFMTPMDGEDWRPQPDSAPEPGRPPVVAAPDPESPARRAPRPPTVRIVSPDGPRNLDPVLAFHSRLPATAPAPAACVLHPHRDFLSPAPTHGRGPAAAIRLTYASPKSPHKK